jgi:hypothetical protein
MIYSIYLESDRSDDNQRRRSIFTDLINIFYRLRVYYRAKRAQASLPASSTTSALSTPYFTFVLWSLVAIKVYQFYWYLILVLFFVIIYKIIKYLLICGYICLTRQPRVQCIIQQIINFLQVRYERINIIFRSINSFFV